MVIEVFCFQAAATCSEIKIKIDREEGVRFSCEIQLHCIRQPEPEELSVLCGAAAFDLALVERAKEQAELQVYLFAGWLPYIADKIGSLRQRM
jgi:hypothetical protein